MLFPATTLLVKMCLERSAERDKHEDKNKISAEDGQSISGGHSKSSPSLLHFLGKRCRIQSQSNTGELVQRAERKYSKLRPFYLMRIMPP